MLLPDDAKLRLIKASKTLNTVTNPDARQQAIEAAEAMNRRMYPTFFRESKYGNPTDLSQRAGPQDRERPPPPKIHRPRVRTDEATEG
jgi:hypothetical protein